MPAISSQIPFYGLYGENPVNSDPGFVHIEEIADRSSDLGWVIKPHRHSKLFQVLCIFDGQLQVTLNREHHQLSGNWIVSIPAGTVHGFRFQPNSQGFVLSVDDSVLANESDQRQLNPATEIQLAPQLIECHPEDLHLKQFLQYIDLIRQEFVHYNADRNQALASLSKLTLLSLNRQLQHSRIHTSSADKESLLLNRFRALVENHFREHWPVALYARNLYVSTSTLGRLCHEYCGVSPKSVVQQRLLAEAKRRLIYTRQTVEEIAYTLGFKDHAYFSRFFKKMEGMTAGNYRKTQI